MVWGSSYESFYVFVEKQMFSELLRPREAVCEHLHASAVPTVCVRASGMVWSSSYEGFHFCFTFELLRPREVVCEHLHASAVPTVCV